MSELSDKVLRITTTYLGPASLTFLERITHSYLQDLAFKDLQKQHISELSKWVGAYAARVIDRKQATVLSQIIAKLG
ncbi:MAG: hypothetical protein MUC50_05430 [Myxococcota bacterium]|jgi:hypothetical protein|nr:hypothetical protein [Myxococcota bacterium]